MRTEPRFGTWQMPCAQRDDRYTDGAAGLAVDHLRRALDEPPTAGHRPEVLVELGWPSGWWSRPAWATGLG